MPLQTLRLGRILGPIGALKGLPVLVTPQLDVYIFSLTVPLPCFLLLLLLLSTVSYHSLPRAPAPYPQPRQGDAVLGTIIEGPCAWTANDYQNDSYVLQLTEEDIAELDAALAHISKKALNIKVGGRTTQSRRVEGGREGGDLKATSV